MQIVLATLSVLLFAHLLPCQADLEGRVVGVSDGDAVTVLASENI